MRLTLPASLVKNGWSRIGFRQNCFKMGASGLDRNIDRVIHDESIGIAKEKFKKGQN